MIFFSIQSAAPSLHRRQLSMTAITLLNKLIAPSGYIESFSRERLTSLSLSIYLVSFYALAYRIIYPSAVGYLFAHLTNSRRNKEALTHLPRR